MYSSSSMSKFPSIFIALLLFLNCFCCVGVAFADPEDETIDYSEFDSSSEAGDDSSVVAAYEEPVSEYIDGKLVYNGQSDAISSLKKDIFMGVFHKKVTNGELIQFDSEKDLNRGKINFEIFTENAEKTYSLYDRFGGNVIYPLYLGEETVYTGFIDKLYNYLTMRPDDQEGFFGVISKIQSVGELLLKEDTAYTDEFYTGRPPLKADGEDPRVTLYNSKEVGTVIDDVGLGFSNYLLDSAKTISAITAFLIDDSIVDLIKDVFHTVFEHDAYTAVQAVFRAIIGFLTVGLVFFIIMGTFKFVVGGGSLRSVLINFVGALLSIGLMVSLVASPLAFVDISANAIKLIDSVSAEAFNKTYEEDEIIHSDVNDNIVEAAIWEDAVFFPWVNGTFGGVDYDKLYTTYAEVDDENKWNLSENSALSIGDISIPLGGGTFVKNWAALAYSCGTIYHIDCVDDGKKVDYNLVGTEKEWPKASMPSSNKSIYVDDFRWIDASLKVGEYPTDEKLAIDPYINYREYKFDGVSSGGRALFMAILLLPLLVIGFKKFSHVMICLGNFFIILGRSCINLINPEDENYNIVSNLKNSLEPFIGYFFYSFMAVLLLYLYKTLASSSEPLIVMLYIAIGVYIMMLSPKSLGTHYEAVKGFYDDSKESLSVAAKTIRDNEQFYKSVSSMPNSVGEVSKNASSGEFPSKNKVGELISQIGYNRIFGDGEETINKNSYTKSYRESDKDVYFPLIRSLSKCERNYEIAWVLIKHRFEGKDDSYERRKKDKQNFKIGEDWKINKSLWDDPDALTGSDIEKEKRKDSILKGDRERIDNKRESIRNDLYTLKNSRGSEDYKRIKSEYLSKHKRQAGLDDEKLELKMLESLKREARKNARDARFEDRSDFLYKLTRNKKSGFSLKIKTYLVIGLLVAWLLLIIPYFLIGL